MHKYLHNDLTHKIIGCAMTVHRHFGASFQELIYQRSLELEFTRQGISFQREQPLSIKYQGERVGKRRVDFLVENRVIVEIKAKSQLEDRDIAQTLNYLKIFGYEVGLLINFGEKSLRVKRCKP